MVETAVGFVVAYLARKAEGVVGRAADDVDAAFDAKLAQLCDWVKAKLTGRASAERGLRMLERDPEVKDNQDLAIEELGTVVVPAETELAGLVAQLERLKPAGLRIRGSAEAAMVSPGGKQTGPLVEGPLPEGVDVGGQTKAGLVHGKNTGVVDRPEGTG